MLWTNKLECSTLENQESTKEEHILGTLLQGMPMDLAANIRPGLGRLASDKHSGLLVRSVNLERFFPAEPGICESMEGTTLSRAPFICSPQG
jgi:hypothetical protein